MENVFCHVLSWYKVFLPNFSNLSKRIDMNNTTIPEGYQQVMPYLIVKGASDFSSFMQKVFGAVESHKTMRDALTVMHAEIKIGECTIMFADSTDQFPPRTSGLFVYVENADETYQKAIEAGAESIMKPADQSYGRSCGITDPFGNTY